ncbi:MAG: DUF1631 domain-containing protein [Pseudomonadales bacterium]|nr:DUF1631 domain-containing protein [Pseudomonadales bacterium]
MISTRQIDEGNQLIEDTTHALIVDINRQISDKFDFSVGAAIDVIAELKNSEANYVNMNAYNQTLMVVRKHEVNVASAFATILSSADRHSNQSAVELAARALNFCTDDLSLVTDEELDYQLKLEEGFGELGLSYEKMLIDGGWFAGSEVFNSTLAKSVDRLRPGSLALLMQDVFTEVIESKPIVRMLYRFVGGYFFEGVVDLYRGLVPELSQVSEALLKPEEASFESDLLENDSVNSLEAFFSAESTEEETKSTTVDVTGLINNWDVPTSLNGEDRESISELDLDQLTPDTMIETLEQDDVAKLLEKMAFTKKLEGTEDCRSDSVREDIKEALAQLSGDGMLTVIDRVSENIVNLVSHLFEDIVNSDNLISEVSLQISRAQLPVMRLALSDTRLFQTANHPVRQYINRLGELGLKVTDSEEKGFDKIKESVEELLEGFDSNNDIYGDLLGGLDNFIENSSYSPVVIEDGLSGADFQVENQEGAALQFLVREHALIENELIFHKFFKVVWGAVLSRIYTAKGDESDAWGEATELHTTIIRSTQVNSGLEGKREILRCLPEIMMGVRTIFDEHELNDDVRNSLLDQLMYIHLKIIRGIDGKNIVDGEAPISNSGDVSDNRDCENEVKGMDVTDIELIKQTVQNIKDEGKLAPNSDLSNSYKHCLLATQDIDFGESINIEELVEEWEQGEKPDQRAVYRFDDNNKPVDFEKNARRKVGLRKDNKVIVAREEKANLVRETFLQVGSMSLGALIECEEDGVATRYQLTHKSTIFGKYTFNDFKRRKSWLLTKPELVMELARGSAKVISAPKLFDDTLENVVGQMQSQGRPDIRRAAFGPADFG